MKVELELLEKVKYDDKGLVPVVAQDVETKEILMLAYMNKESLQSTLDTGLATYFSRSRQSFWVKGETSGHFQHVEDIYIDCDGDTLLMKVRQVGPACHTGSKTCFFRKLGEK